MLRVMPELTRQAPTPATIPAPSCVCSESALLQVSLADMGPNAHRAIRMLQMQCTMAYSRSQQVPHRIHLGMPVKYEVGERRLHRLTNNWLLTDWSGAGAEDIADQIVYAATR